MKKIYLFLIAMVMVAAVFAQKPEVTVKVTTAAPEIDAIADDLWDNFDANAIEGIYTGTAPTVTPTFKLAADASNIYLLLMVEDDNHYPSWMVAGSNNYEYDKVEVYFDVNEVLNDAKGPSAAASGHYQFAPAFAEAGYDIPVATATDAVCYMLDGDGYVYEASFAYSRFSNADAVVMSNESIANLPEGLGFDITVVDRDEATNTRDRMVWANTNGGGLGESWTNMDECGVLRIPVVSGSKTFAATSMKAYPNPAVDNVTINADFNQVVISNVIGQQVKTMAASSKTINISDLSKGVYVIKAYKNDKYVGTAKVTKN
jgi:hypothetical protein